MTSYKYINVCAAFADNVLFHSIFRYRLSESTIDGARLMAQAISLDSKFDVRVSTFGTSSGILIHAEKIGNKSLNRKN